MQNSLSLCLSLGLSRLFFLSQLSGTQGMHTNLAAKMAAINFIVVVYSRWKVEWMSRNGVITTALSMGKCIRWPPIIFALLCDDSFIRHFFFFFNVSFSTQHANSQTFLFNFISLHIFLLFCICSLSYSKNNAIFLRRTTQENSCRPCVRHTQGSEKLQETKHETWKLN